MTDEKNTPEEPRQTAPRFTEVEPGDQTPSAEPPPRQPHPMTEGPAGDGAPLDPSKEKTIWVGRAHWTHFIGFVVLCGVLLIAAILLFAFVIPAQGWMSKQAAFTTALIICLGLILLAVIRVLAGVILYRYRLTDQRLFVEKGIFSQTIDQTELIRVDDVRVKKSLVDRLLGLGSVEMLSSTDVTHKTVMIAGIRNAEEIAERIRSSMRNLRRKSLFIENL